MIDINELRTFVEGRLKDTEYFLTDLKITPANEITVEIDSMTPGDIEQCVELTRAIEEAFDRDVEDYELEVGTAGLTSPLKVRRQYDKYVGRDLEVLTTDGRKLHGMLRSVSDEGIILSSEQKVKKEGQKKPVVEQVETELPFAVIKKAVYDLKFWQPYKQHHTHEHHETICRSTGLTGLRHGPCRLLRVSRRLESRPLV